MTPEEDKTSEILPYGALVSSFLYLLLIVEFIIPFKEGDKFHLCVTFSICYLKLQMKRIRFIFVLFYTHLYQWDHNSWDHKITIFCLE